VSGLSPVREVEPLVTKTQLVDVLGVSEDTIDEMRKAGMPCIRWGRRLIRFRASDCLAWFEEHGREEAA
jgi:phage terminase Nu1 subunit (DNA packaging protein)